MIFTVFGEFFLPTMLMQDTKMSRKKEKYLIYSLKFDPPIFNMV